MNISDFLYTYVKDPLNDDNVIREIIQRYLECDLDEDKLYAAIQKGPKTEGYREKFENAEYVSAYINFKVDLFNKWKNNILKLSDRECKDWEMHGKKMLDLKRYLQDVEDIPRTGDVSARAMVGRNNLRLERLLGEKQFGLMRSDDTDGSFFHIKSHRVNASTESIQNLSHRLYMDVVGKDIFTVITEFMDKCDELRIPYYFKFVSSPMKREDRIVIYSDDEHLLKYVKICMGIKERHPEIEFDRPPLLGGRIKDWLSYGAEPIEMNKKKEKGEDKESYSSIRTRAICSALADVHMELKDAGWPPDFIKAKVASFIDGTYNRYGETANYIRGKIKEKCPEYGIDSTRFFLDLNGKKVFRITLEDIEKRIAPDVISFSRFPMDTTGLRIEPIPDIK